MTCGEESCGEINVCHTSKVNMAEYSQSRGKLNMCDGPFLLNKHGDLCFLSHKNIVHISSSLIKEKIKKKFRKEKNPQPAKACAKPLLQTTTLRTIYVHVVLNGVICPQILYDIVLYARHFLLVNFFPKCYFNKVCFELPQNVT